ncbi:CLN_G0043590.mRNA.1.CDS.1 [Saccharomyces cerevisiae]|nr:CLN_G0043590.mRNA.1.CDS.1 [Saccharomyces cerevisiae]CAI5310305.1 CMF_HP2_G0039120.mRNA.1.CDS.1 [Saccharomyces cerevisiae]CAI6677622.1 CMF_HP2_G0039120.mRNA.1.CDS.1 [Saccharomyces cerevisiae]CAI6766668.1 CMF_HP1_G0047810.mRNA.1.CDS.1 [Saccharomyces cerevisiae]CAI7435635.1 CLN_G0043590.mRNA.1.CDS.1 [Saccharomyces cerevisiae]
MAHIPEVLPKSIPIPAFIVTTSSYLWYYFNLVLTQIPGGQFIVSYIKKSHHDDPYRTTVEIGLILYGIIYYLSKPQQKKSLQAQKPNLSPQEIDALIEDWEPEPLVDPSATDEQSWRVAKTPVTMEMPIQNHITITRNNLQEKYTNVFNLASNNFLQLSATEPVKEVVKTTIKNYGVGACGPAGFYGNQDVHYTLEYDLAQFFGTQGSVLYGQDFCAAPSVLPAFTKRGDVIVADDQVSLPVQNALQLSRSTVYYFNHNDMNSLECLLNELTEQEKLEKLPAIPRKFIVTEGIFHNSGDLAPLPELTKLKNKYKFRLFVDETFSIGVLGATGRGLSEHFNMDRATAIDITVGSMATALGSTGGFVLGDSVMCLHQRIGSNAYCFSACLPAYTVTSVSKVLKLMDSNNDAVQTLQKLSKSLHDSFASDDSLRSYVIVTSSPVSAVLHLQLTPAYRSRKFGYTCEQLFETMSALQKKSQSNKFIEPYEEEEKFLQSIVDHALINYNVLITRNTIVLKQETLPIVPSLKICCNAAMSPEELKNACESVKQSILACCQESNK